MAARRTERVVRVLSWVLVFVAPAAAAASWFTPRPDLDRSDAVETAVGALAEVGFDGTVTDRVVRSVHEPDDGDPISVWIVPVEVDGEEVELRVERAAGRLVYVDDRIGADDSERLLSDGEFRAIGRYRNDATLDRWVARNAAASLAAVAIAVVGYVLARRSDRLWGAP